MEGARKDTLLDPLPPEVMEVSDRIGLNRSVPMQITESFLANRLPERTQADLRFKSYIFKDIPNAKKYQPEAKSSKRRLTSAQRRRVFKLDKNTADVKYSTFKEINEIWNDYIGSVIGDIRSESDQLNLIRADFHGALLVISASVNPALIGHKGIVVQESKHTFNLINENDRLITIAKKGTIFSFAHQNQIYQLNGDYLLFTPHQRSRAKVKTRK